MSLSPITIYDSSTSTTTLKCTINTIEAQNFGEETILTIEDGPTQISSDPIDTSVTFNFAKFEKISELIEISQLTLKYLDEDTIDKVLQQIGLLEVYHILYDLSVGPDRKDYEDHLNYLRENIDFNILNSAENTIIKFVTPSIFL